MSRGFTLDQVPGRVSWRAVKAMLANPWEDAEHLLAAVADVANWLQWSKTEDGQHGLNMPDRIRRPDDARREAEHAREVDEMIAAAHAAGLMDRRGAS